ncbi:MAG: MFS transporter [Thermoleophilaceae bacterium]
MRRLLLLVSAIVLLDTSFYAAITPLLPYYAEHEELTKTSAGVLAAAYPAGTMLASLPAGAIGARVGGKLMLAFGLSLLALSSLTFGLAHSIVLLDAARFAQGIGGAVSWVGGMGLLSSAAPVERRAELMGTAFGAAAGGALLGPVVGAIGRAAGPGPTFGAISSLAVALLVLVLREHVPAAAQAREPGGLAAAIRHPVIARGAWLVGCTALFFGVLDVLLPLQLAALGAAGGVIAGVFLAGAALEAGIAPLSGRYADRHGWVGPARAGLVAIAAMALVASLPDSVALLGLVGVVAAPAVGVLWVPGLLLLGHGSDAAGLDHSYAYAVMNLLWAGSQAVGSAGGGALAEATTDFVPYAIVAGIALATLATLTPRTRQPTASSA